MIIVLITGEKKGDKPNHIAGLDPKIVFTIKFITVYIVETEIECIALQSFDVSTHMLGQVGRGFKRGNKTVAYMDIFLGNRIWIMIK